MQTKTQADKLYRENEKYIGQTIRRQFPLHEQFAATHGLDTDDLIQYGRIGLYRACRTFDPKKGKTMRNHAIQNIIWSIQDELPKDSLNNVDNKSLVLLDKNSLDVAFSSKENEDLLLHDVVGEEDRGYGEKEVRTILENLKGKFADKLIRIVELRYLEYTFDEIGQVLDCSPQYCSQLLKTNKEKLKRVLFA
ncbi:sigma-70 family RNA polymerase sigma factor [Bacillus sp. FJAT-22090]|uniref:sigma-70 family RNA polymerase sigma factor n=1 Tax=Bacillus sp. FJAT-22090 TaxID=1581038 RepID=UPI001642A9BE|nr:sigma-70 family RNA polymerase sigma factor [Bacillus sp. FJAT-22090]